MENKIAWGLGLVAAAAALVAAAAYFAPGLLTGDRTVSRDGGLVLVFEVQTDELPDSDAPRAVERAFETIRRRGAELDVRPTITRKGRRRIVVRVPGVTEESRSDRLVQLFRRRGEFGFHLVDEPRANRFFRRMADAMPTPEFKMRRTAGRLTITHPKRPRLEEFFAGRTDDDHFVGYQFHPVYETREKKRVDPNRSYWKSFYLVRNATLTGRHLESAQVQVDERTKRPVVSVTMTDAGADRFATFTKRHVGDRFAIVFDGTVESAPVINEPIPGGRAQISLGALRSYRELTEEARGLVAVLRSGAYPAPLKIVDRRTVEP